jgi:hypothetical protein
LLAAEQMTVAGFEHRALYTVQREHWAALLSRGGEREEP